MKNVRFPHTTIAAMNSSATFKRCIPLVARYGSTQSAANAKLAAFREAVHARKSAKRFQPDREVPAPVWRDILSMTLVRPYF